MVYWYNMKNLNYSAVRLRRDASTAGLFTMQKSIAPVSGISNEILYILAAKRLQNCEGSIFKAKTIADLVPYGGVGTLFTQ